VKSPRTKHCGFVVSLIAVFGTASHPAVFEAIAHLRSAATLLSSGLGKSSESPQRVLPRHKFDPCIRIPHQVSVARLRRKYGHISPKRKIEKQVKACDLW